MFDVPLRRLKDQLGEPLAARWSGVSPNSVSLVAFGVGLLTAALAGRSRTRRHLCSSTPQATNWVV